MFLGGSFRKWGRGAGMPRVELPKAVPVSWDDFSGGVDLRETGEPNKTHDGIDLEVTLKNKLVVMPGVSQTESLLGRDIKRMITQGSLDNRSELIMLAPPFVGVKEEGATVWEDLSFGTGPFAWTVFAGTLLLTDGFKVWKREPRQSFVESPDVPVGRTYATFAARAMAGNVIIDGDLEPLMVRWSAANSDPEDWEGLGSGFELLIDDMSAGDRVVRLVPMGLDHIAVLMRRSVWMGQRTGNSVRPVDFRPRVPGIGCVAAATARATPQGVLFLSEDGVQLFDGNRAQTVSEQINSEILPLDFDNLVDYKAIFDPGRQRYILMTPTQSYVLDITKGRWYRWTLRATDAVMFAEQFGRTTWADLTGSTWADLAGQTWHSFSPEESAEIDLIYGQSDGVNSQIGEETDATIDVFDDTMTPRWTFPFTRGPFLDQLITTKEVLAEYTGVATLDFYLKDIEGNLDLVVSQALPLQTIENTYRIPIIKTGRGIGLQIRVSAGRPTINAIGASALGRRRKIQDESGAGPRIYNTDF